MRISAIQILIACTLAGVTLANANYAQVLDKKLTIRLVDVPLEEILAEVEAQTEVKFIYSIDQLGVHDLITLIVESKPLRSVLDELLHPYGINYKVFDKESTITLKRQKDNRQQKSESNLDTKSKRVLLEGTVLDATTKQPMAGVNIIIKGSTIGTTTDASGKYTIDANEGDILIFSFIGYQTLEIRASNQSVLDIELTEDIQSLKEVVINAGYYTTTKMKQTGNIGKVEAKDIQKQPVANPLASLQGRIAGLEIVQQTGVPGGNFQVRIRGQNSIANGNDPLYIIDGVPYTNNTLAFQETSQLIFMNGTSPLNAINPADIESIEVLKDADATAIYGSRGSNGVILITTKKGQVGKTRVSANFYSGIGKVTRKMDLLNSAQYLTMRKEALQNMGLWPLPDVLHQYVPDVFVWDTTRYTDWQKELLGNSALTTDAQLSISGGDRQTNFLIGTAYHKEGVVFPGNNYDQRIATNMSLSNLSANEKFRTTISVKYSVNKTDLIKRDLTTTALTLSPVAPPMYDAMDNVFWDVNTWSEAYPNPIAYTKTAYEAQTNNFLLNATVAYKIRSNVELKINTGSSRTTLDAITTTPKSSLHPNTALVTDNESIFASSKFSNWMVEPQLNWRPTFKQVKTDILVGTTFLEQIQEGVAQYAYGFANESLMKNISAASSTLLSTNYYSQYRYSALFGRINFSLKDKYILNITGRRDGSSRFGPGNQFANFGAVGMAWIFSNEDFIANAIPFLSFGKLRGSLGITGNDQLGNYQYMDTYTSSGPYQGTVGLAPVRLANPDFAWETNKKLEAAIEWGFWENKVQTSVSYYRNRSSNQLVGFPLPPTTGFNTIQGNFPAIVQNTGIEIEWSSKNLNRKNFTWSTSANISIPKNKLLEFPNLSVSPAYANTLVVGQPLSILKRYNYTGVDEVTGLYKFEDVNGDGKINALDKKSIVFVGQRYFGGLNNSVQYKSFQLDFLVQFVKQKKLNYLSTFTSNPGDLSNQPAWVMSRWQSENDKKDIQQFTFTVPGNSAHTLLSNSTRSIGDASFVRLKNISMSYTVRPDWCNKVKLVSARFFIMGQNVMTVTKYEGLDPETGSNALPPLRVWSAGMSVTF